MLAMEYAAIHDTRFGLLTIYGISTLDAYDGKFKKAVIVFH